MPPHTCTRLPAPAWTHGWFWLVWFYWLPCPLHGSHLDLVPTTPRFVPLPHLYTLPYHSSTYVHTLRLHGYTFVGFWFPTVRLLPDFTLLHVAFGLRFVHGSFATHTGSLVYTCGYLLRLVGYWITVTVAVATLQVYVARCRGLRLIPVPDLDYVYDFTTHVYIYLWFRFGFGLRLPRTVTLRLDYVAVYVGYVYVRYVTFVYVGLYVCALRCVTRLPHVDYLRCYLPVAGYALRARLVTPVTVYVWITVTVYTTLPHVGYRLPRFLPVGWLRARTRSVYVVYVYRITFGYVTLRSCVYVVTFTFTFFTHTRYHTAFGFYRVTDLHVWLRLRLR